MHLRVTRESWTHGVPQIIVVVLFAEFLGEFRSFGPWSDEAHLATKNVPQLRQFIQARTPQIISHTGTARIVRYGPDSSQVVFGIFSHRPELDNREWLAAKSNTGLPVKDGTLVAQTYN